jgi:hypothetical protein
MSTENHALVTRLYTCFVNSDGDGMAACYHPEASFSDPVFPNLSGSLVGDMWRMLNSKKADPASRSFTNVQATATTGSAHWEARYKFPLNGLPVHNIIEAQFEFKDGLIYKHVDTFDFYWWARQAFGVQGFLMGWTDFFKGKVRASIRARLDAFVKSRADAAAAGAAPAAAS